MAHGRNCAALGGRARDARVSLRSERARRVQAVDGTVRDTGRRDGRHAARGKIRGSASRGETGASRAAMRYIEHHLELGWKGETLAEVQREAMEGYNREDCASTAALRDWLEVGRAKLVEMG